MSNPAQTRVPWSANVKVCLQLNRRGAGKSLAALPEHAIVKRTAPISVISVVLLAACGALCQSERRADGLLQRDGTKSPEVQSQEIRTWKSLPDAPSSTSSKASREGSNIRPSSAVASNNSHCWHRLGHKPSEQNSGASLPGRSLD